MWPEQRDGNRCPSQTAGTGADSTGLQFAVQTRFEGADFSFEVRSFRLLPRVFRCQGVSLRGRPLTSKLKINMSAKSLIKFGSINGTIVKSNKTGKAMYERFCFAGKQSASSLRQQGKDQGLKGKELTAYVNSLLTGDAATAAWIQHEAFVSAVRSKGGVPVNADMKAKSGVSRYAFPDAPKAPSTADTAKSLGVDQAALEAFMASQKAAQAAALTLNA